MKIVKMKKHTNILLFIASILMLSSCAHFEELNTDPATTTRPDVPSIISAVELRLSGERETQWRSLCYFHMGVTQMIADGWTVSRGQVYELDNSYVEYMWKSYYQMINNLELAKTEAAKTPAMINYKASAMVMQVLLFSQLTDTYGDIPYFDAVKGYQSGNMFPKYDIQEAIYNDFFIKLTEATSLFDSSKPFTWDLIYNGNVAKWKKFTNSLRLRLAMRLVNVNPTKAKAEAIIAFQGGLMQTYEESALVKHANYDVSTSGMSEIRGNGFSQVQRFSEEIIFGCATYTDYLRDNNDPRFKMMFGIYGPIKGTALSRVNSKSTTSTSIEVTNEYKQKYGTLHGQPRATFFFEDFSAAGIDWSTHIVQKGDQQVQIDKIFKCLQIRRELTTFDAPTIYLPYSEVELWLAEAEQRGWNITSETAQAHFEKAVTAHVIMLEKVQGAIAPVSTELASYKTAIWESDVDKLKVINMQQYVCNFFNGIEGFANWRRSGYPQLKSASTNKTDTKLNKLIPRRMPYPLTEMNYNAENVSSHLYNGINFWGAPVWWDTDIERGVDKN